MAGGGGAERAGAQIGDMHVAGGQRGQHFRAALELAPLQRPADGFSYKPSAWATLRIDPGLVADDDGRLGGVCRQGEEGQAGETERQQGTVGDEHGHGEFLNKGTQHTIKAMFNIKSN